MTALLEEKIELTDEDLLALCDDGLYELIDGQLVDKSMGAISLEVGFIIAIILRQFCDKNDLGKVSNEPVFQCFPKHPLRIRRPDVAFIAKGKLPDEKLPDGHLKVVPDLVVEVNSPTDKICNVERKIREYFEIGVRQVWMVNPTERFVRVHRPNGICTEFHGDAEITGEDIIPGFACKVSEFFKTI